jgi:hypothetical protein
LEASGADEPTQHHFDLLGEALGKELLFGTKSISWYGGLASQVRCADGVNSQQGGRCCTTFTWSIIIAEHYQNDFIDENICFV